jgi:hypothetical protein
MGVHLVIIFIINIKRLSVYYFKVGFYRIQNRSGYNAMECKAELTHFCNPDKS